MVLLDLFSQLSQHFSHTLQQVSLKKSSLWKEEVHSLQQSVWVYGRDACTHARTHAHTHAHTHTHTHTHTPHTHTHTHTHTIDGRGFTTQRKDATPGLDEVERGLFSEEREITSSQIATVSLDLATSQV